MFRGLSPEGNLGVSELRQWRRVDRFESRSDIAVRTMSAPNSNSGSEAARRQSAAKTALRRPSRDEVNRVQIASTVPIAMKIAAKASTVNARYAAQYRNSSSTC